MSETMAGGAARWGDLIVTGDARRREVRRRHGNGLDTVEVDQGGRRLVLTFLEHAPEGIHRGNIRIDGSHGAPHVAAARVRRATEDDPRLEDRLYVELIRPGGAGPYVVRLVEPSADGNPGWAPLRGLDPRFAQLAFTFDVDLPNPAAATPPGPAAGGADLQASYLARDYEGLRQLILDRLAQTMPAWTERHVADIGITLVELLAYAGDDLSYYQDAVATEAYLQTARRRISVRRHARLVDYHLGEGCQARAWVCLTVGGAAELPLADLVFMAAPGWIPVSSPLLPADVLQPGRPNLPRPYSPVNAAATLSVRPAHNQVSLWTWGERSSWLAKGATTAVLVDKWTDASDHGLSGPRALGLRPGDVVVFEATVDPSGLGPPDMAQRHPVRLTAVRPSVDPLYDQPILEIAWAPADALPFDLQVSASGPGDTAAACAVVRANTVLVGEGCQVSEVLEHAPYVLTHPNLTWASPFPDPAAVARHQATQLRRLPARWRREIEAWGREVEAGEPLGGRRIDELERLLGQDTVRELGLESGEAEDQLEGLRRLLLQAGELLASRVRRLEVLAALAGASGPLDTVLIDEVATDWGDELTGPLRPGDPAAWGPAAAATSPDVRGAMPLLQVAPADGSGPGWTVVADLVGGRPGSRQVMVEMDETQLGHLRFSPGDAPSGRVRASYQVGNGAAGNVPAEGINAMVATTTPPPLAALVVQGLRNASPAAGGVDPEAVAAAKVALPGAYLVGQPRAIVAADYSALAEQVAGVRSAATVLRWTGTGYAAEVAVQPTWGEHPDEELLAAVDGALRPCRRIGHRLWVRPPIYRPLVIGLNVDVAPAAVRAEVGTALRALFSSGWQGDGTPGLFNPQRVSFGQTLHASAILAAVHDVTGVEAALLTRFGFLSSESPGRAAIQDPISLRPSEIARLDNDPGAPEHGYAVVNLQGGQ